MTSAGSDPATALIPAAEGGGALGFQYQFQRIFASTDTR